MTHGQTSTLITAIVLIVGFAAWVFVHFREKKRGTGYHERAFNAYNILRKRILAAPWHELRNTIPELIEDFEQEYYGRMDKNLLLEWADDLHSIRASRLAVTRPNVKTDRNKNKV